MKGLPGADRWKLAAWSEMSPESFFHGPVGFPVAGDAGPLVKTANRPVAGVSVESAGGPGGVPGVARPGPAADQNEQVTV